MKKSTDKSPKIAILRKIPFFKGVSDFDLKEISRKFSETEFKKGLIPWSKGKKLPPLSQIAREKISKSPFKLSSIVRRGGDGIYDGYNSLVYLKINEMILC